MTLDIQAVHFTLRDDGREYLKKKLDRLRTLEANVIDLLITLSKEAKEFEADATINFRWGVSSHVKERDSDLNAAIDKLVDSLDAKVNKEKEKAQERR
jgi:putative sigma-54 modulation protein